MSCCYPDSRLLFILHSSIGNGNLPTGQHVIGDPGDQSVTDVTCKLSYRCRDLNQLGCNLTFNFLLL
jgi:hypothetical protein